MSIIVYHLDTAGYPHAAQFSDSELSPALKFMEELRKAGFHHVTYSSEHGEHVGKPGVSEIVDGKLDDGTTYEWSKAGRAGKIRRSERAKWDEENAKK